MAKVKGQHRGTKARQDLLAANEEVIGKPITVLGERELPPEHQGKWIVVGEPDPDKPAMYIKHMETGEVLSTPRELWDLIWPGTYPPRVN